MTRQRIKPDRIFKLETAICKAANLTLEELTARNRSHRLVLARHAVWYIANRRMGYSSLQLAELYERDHTTVLYGIRKLENDDKTRQALVDGIAKTNPELLEKKETIPDWNWG